MPSMPSQFSCSRVFPEMWRLPPPPLQADAVWGEGAYDAVWGAAAAEEGGRIVKSVNVLLLLMRQKVLPHPHIKSARTATHAPRGPRARPL